MKKIEICRFVLLLILCVVFLNNCKSAAGESQVFSSPNQAKQYTLDSMQNNRPSLNGIKVFFSPTDAQARVSEPVLVNFTIQNNSASAIKLDLGADRQEGFLFTLIFPDGKKLQLPALVKEGVSRSGNITIESQQSYRQSLLFNQWFQFTYPGTYILETQVASPIKTEDGNAISAEFTSNLVLNVLPKDPEHLKETSNLLIQRIIASNNYEDIIEDALKLSYINDPVAVPYLQKALTLNKMIDPIVMKGLERIGDKNSVQALITIVNEKPTSEEAALAKYSLRMIEDKSLDSRIKRMINQFLHSAIQN